MSKKTDADQIASFIYTFLEQRMTREALETFLHKGWRAKGSMSVHGFMGMLIDLHSKKYPRSNPRIQMTAPHHD
jgi:hypothetical protein